MNDEQLIDEFSKVVAETVLEMRRDQMRGMTHEQIERKHAVVLSAVRRLEAIIENGKRRDRLQRVK